MAEINDETYATKPTTPLCPEREVWEERKQRNMSEHCVLKCPVSMYIGSWVWLQSHRQAAYWIFIRVVLPMKGLVPQPFTSRRWLRKRCSLQGGHIPTIHFIRSPVDEAQGRASQWLGRSSGQDAFPTPGGTLQGCLAGLEKRPRSVMVCAATPWPGMLTGVILAPLPPLCMSGWIEGKSL